MSNTNHKTAMKSITSVGQEVELNSNVTVLLPDFCPILGKSKKFSNICYNFGGNNKLFDNDKSML